jgi:peroxiredoxin
MNPTSFTELPANLPVPQDDGVCAHLRGKPLPDIALLATSGQQMNLHRQAGLSVIYIYPMTGRPGVALPAGWDEIPGARGCTPESCGFRDQHAAIRSLGAEVYGLSSQSTDYQREVHDRLHLTFDLLSDERFHFADALALPAFSVAGVRLLRRVTLVSFAGVIEHVFYPIFPPDRHAAEVVAYLRARTASQGA